MVPKKRKRVDMMDSLRLQSGQTGTEKWKADVTAWPRRSFSVHRGHQTVPTQASTRNLQATAVFREIEDDANTAAKLTEMSGSIQNLRESNLCHFVMLASSQLCYFTGSREMFSMA